MTNTYGIAKLKGVNLFNKNNLIYWYGDDERPEYYLASDFNSYVHFLKNSYNFTGRASIAQLYAGSSISIISILPCIILLEIFGDNIFLKYLILGIILLVVVMPYVSLLVRRLHDGYNSGLWILLILFPPFSFYTLFLIYFIPSWQYKEIKD